MTRPALLSLLLCLPFVMRAEITPGEILLGEMNCAACHDAGAVKARLASRESPRLGADGVNLTPQWLRGFLSDPQKEKPDTLMPDMLHGLTAEQKTEAAEALTHYLVSLRRSTTEKGIGTSVAALAEGERLYHSLGCVQCHAPLRLPEGKENDPAAKEEFAKLQASSVSLTTNIASKYTVTELMRFLRDPLKVRPSGRMPAMNLTEGEAQAIATYLLREQVPAGKVAATAGLHYDYYQKDFPELPEFDRLKPDESGTTDVPTLKVAKRKGSYALRFMGSIQIPKDGYYTFYTDSDDGTRLYIDEKLVVENGGIHPGQERSGKVKLKSGAHTFTLSYFDGGGETSMRVLWKGPDLDKKPIPAEVFSHDSQPLVPLGDAPFTVDAAKAERGKALFAEYNCAACHAGTDIPARPAKALAQLVARQPRGCLSSKPAAGVPSFEITDRQRQVILAQLQEQTSLNTPLNDEEQIRRTLTVLNCYACHQRDRRGGPDGLRREYFANVGEVDLGEEGKLPPALTGVGAKLQQAWLKEVLEKGEKVRPYMATRMPQFGAKNIAPLPALFDRVDTAADAQTQPNVSAEGAAANANKFGRKLIGVGGLTCIACHNFAGNKSLGVPAVDLASVGQRLKWDWFRKYLLDPQALRPGTRMPSFFPGGEAVNKDVLGGDTEKQIASIWAYLARKNFTDLPAGLVQGKLEIVASNEAVMYRNFIEGGSPRAIGVGYPEKANLCFDANEMRLAMIWQGPFIDASKHRSGRGAGFEKPLGTNVVKGPPGPPFAVLTSQSEAWPAKSEGYHFRGYHLDAKRRPAFRYSMGSVDVEDFPIAVPGEVDAGFERTLTLTAKDSPGSLYFRAAVAPKIEEKDGVFAVGENLRLKFPGAKPLIRNVDGKQELLLPVTFQDGKAVITEAISW